MRRLLGWRSKNKPRELVPESRRLDPPPVKGKGIKSHSKNKTPDVSDVVHLSGSKGDSVSRRVEAEVKQGNDQEVYQYEMPTNELGFGDFLKDHVPGERMPGIAISKKSSQPREALMRELEQMQPDVERRPIRLPKKFVLPLQNQEEKFCLDSVFTSLNPKYPYILIRKVSFVLTPLSSFFDDFTNVNVMILDTRMLNRPKRQTLTLNSNVDYRGSLSLDYCFPARSLHKMFLYMQLEVQLMEVGEEWGTMLMKIEAEELDFPVTEEFQPVAAVAQLPPSGLVRYKFDPTHMNLTIRDSHRQHLLELYESGDLADSTKPILNKTGRVKYASTSAARPPRGGVVDQMGNVDWSNIRASGRMDADMISTDPDEGSAQEEVTTSNPFKERALAVQRARDAKKAMKSKLPLKDDILSPVETVNDDDSSLLSFEKEANQNMEANRALVAFQVGAVRE
jgi:hypothetical protein